LLINRIRTMAAGFQDLVATIQRKVEAEGLSHPTISTLAQRIKSRATLCQARLEMKS
jgi:hypothetical protein